PGMTLPNARAQLDALSHRLEQDYPRFNTGWTIDMAPIRDTYVGDTRLPLLALQGAALFVLLIACANLASLLLARAIAQQKQFAVRIALGARGSAIFARIAAEAAILSCAGAMVGLALTYWSLAVLPSIAPEGIMNVVFPQFKDVPINGWIMFFALLGCITISMIMAVIPVLRVSTTNFIVESLSLGTRTSTRSNTWHSLQSTLIAIEVSLSLMLMIGSGLMVRSISRLESRNLGIATDHLMTMRIALPMNRYGTVTAVSNLTQQVLPQLLQLPGVESVGTTSVLPLSGMATRRPFQIDGDTTAMREGRQANYRVVSPDYFKTMGVRLLKG